MTYQFQTHELSGAPASVVPLLPAPLRSRFISGDRRAWRRRRRLRALRQTLNQGEA